MEYYLRFFACVLCAFIEITSSNSLKTIEIDNNQEERTSERSKTQQQLSHCLWLLSVKWKKRFKSNMSWFYFKKISFIITYEILDELNSKIIQSNN